MTFTPQRHDLPYALVAPDSPLSSDVMGRTVEALEYVWQVTTGTADADGGTLPGPQGHTHDDINDQTLVADSALITGWPFGFGGVRVVPDSATSPDPVTPHYDPNGGWANGAVTGVLTPIRGRVQIPYDPAGTNVAFVAYVMIEKGSALSAPGAVQVQVNVGAMALGGVSTIAAAGLEAITIGPFAAATIPAGETDLVVTIATSTAADYARLWNVAVST